MGRKPIAFFSLLNFTLNFVKKETIYLKATLNFINTIYLCK